jgi:hypothetical protein
MVAPMEPVDAPAERRWGLLTGETALVLALIAVIVAGTALVNVIQPPSSRTNTVYGKTTMKVHNLGKGGIQPGAVTPRAYIPPQHLVSNPGEVPPEPPPPTPIATKPPKPTPTATPKPTTGTGTGTGPILGGGGGTAPGGGGKPCGLLGLATCPESPAPTPSSPPASEPSAAPTTAGTEPAAAAQQKSAQQKSAQQKSAQQKSAQQKSAQQKSAKKSATKPTATPSATPKR